VDEGKRVTTAERHATAREMFEERAAIREFYAGYPRNEAERLAKIEAAAWLKANPATEGA
jgi:hypothetical protein